MLGSAVFATLPAKINAFFQVIIFAGSLMAYLQNLFLNKQLMKTDGSKIDWSIYKNYTVLNTVIWIAVVLVIVILFFKWSEKVTKAALYISGFIALMQIFTAVTMLISNPYSVKSDKMYVLSSEDEFRLGSEENVIVLILDRYGNVTFDNGWEADESFLDVYKDFTYYNNANSKYNYTFPSIPYMLTHVDPDCDITTNEYKSMAWTEGHAEEFHDRLSQQGYTYHFYTGSDRACFLDASYLVGNVDNVMEQDGISYKINQQSMFYLFTKTSLYKYAPYLVKPYLEVQSFYFDGIVSFEGKEACIEDNGEFYEKLCTDGMSIDPNTDKMVVITHLSGIHTPLSIDANGNMVDESETDQYQVQLGLNVILGKYFEELKRLGIYDSSTIIITADHGQYKDALDPQPIYLIKPAGQTQDRTVFSNAPISSEDLLPTILEITGCDTTGFGTPISAIGENEQRERQCFYPNDGFEVYTYTGDKEELRTMISEGIYTKIDATEDWD